MNKKRLVLICTLLGILVIIGVALLSTRFGSDMKIAYAENNYGSTMKSSFYYFNGSNSKKVKFSKGDTVKMLYSINLKKGSLHMSLKDQNGKDILNKSEGAGEVSFTVDQTQKYQLDIVASKAKGNYKLTWSK